MQTLVDVCWVLVDKMSAPDVDDQVAWDAMNFTGEVMSRVVDTGDGSSTTGLLASNLIMRACGAVNQAATGCLQGWDDNSKITCIDTLADLSTIARTKGRLVRGHNPSVNPVFMTSAAKRYRLSEVAEKEEDLSQPIDDYKEYMATLEPLMCDEEQTSCNDDLEPLMCEEDDVSGRLLNTSEAAGSSTDLNPDGDNNEFVIVTGEEV